MTTPAVTINRAQRLYVIPTGRGYSCLGFDVCKRWTQGYADFAGRPDLAPPPRVGTAKAWRAYQTALRAAAAHHAVTRQRATFQLTPALVGLEGKRVEVISPDGERRRFIVGKSMGWVPIHLEIARRTSHGGGAAYVPEGATVSVVG